MSVIARTLWNSRLIWILEEAFERISISPNDVTGEQLTSALRSVQLQLIEWSADFLSPWLVEHQDFPLTHNQATVLLPTGAVGVAEAVYRDPQGLDTPVTLISREHWARLPDKAIVGDRPTHLWVDKRHRQQSEAHPRQYTAYMWQRPGHNAGTLILNLIMTVQNQGSMGEEPEVPYTWLDALAAGVAERLAEKFKPELVASKAVRAKEAKQIAVGSTSERTPLRLTWTPRSRHG